MEMRVWVDGTQRVVCGVKLTTTCQEIVFALAHATQQAGRFTMIERWRNNERLLSPNEQPLVTLQRWGDHMNEVEFILRKTSADITQPNQPPAVPAKPRLIAPIAPVANIPAPHQQLRPMTNSQMNFYAANQISFNMYPLAGHMRPRHPPRYLDYMEAIANRNATSQPMMPNQAYPPQNHQTHGNIFQRPFDPLQMYNIPRQNGSSPSNSAMNSYMYRCTSNGLLNGINYDTQNDPSEVSPQSASSGHLPRLLEPGIVINRGAAVNVKLTPNAPNHQNNHQNSSLLDPSDDLPQSTSDIASSVTEIGHNMLKVIEEQKKVLINQKNELDRLDNDQEYWETRHNSEQTELVNRIDSEIRQLQTLWKENQTQIQKLENQGFEKELEKLKADQLRMEEEIETQKAKLIRCEKDIDLCKTKIDELEAELAQEEQSASEDESAASNSPSEVNNDYMIWPDQWSSAS